MTNPLSTPSRITRSSLADLAYETLLEAIITGRLRPGATLTTVSIAQDLDISRTPVAEALVRLTADGLIEQENFKRARVRAFAADEVAEVYQMRQILEPEAAALAAVRLGDEQLARLRSEIDELSPPVEGVDWAERAMQFDVTFHDQLAEACGRRLLAKQIKGFRRLVRSFCRLSGQEANLMQALAEHEAILQYLEARDPENARQAMRRHIDNRMRAVLELQPWNQNRGGDHDAPR